MTAVLVNQSKVKDVCSPFRVSVKFYPALEAHVVDLIERAKTRAEQNGRTTLMPQDL
ncbi:MAG: DUF1931 domain-containing protein [Methanobacteriota archaeon]